MSVSLKVEHGVNHVLKHPRSGYRSVFCHMTDYEYGYSLSLGNLQKNSCSLSYLTDGTRSRAYRFVKHRLYGIYDYNLGLFLSYHIRNNIKVGLAQQGHRIGKLTDSVGTQLYLNLRFLSGYIEYIYSCSRQISACL